MVACSAGGAVMDREEYERYTFKENAKVLACIIAVAAFLATCIVGFLHWVIT
jgi:hypothetical protein